MLEVNSELFRYGVRAPTEECSLGILLISLQSIVGVVIQVARIETTDLVIGQRLNWELKTCQSVHNTGLLLFPKYL